ncbi:hypothetical protein [Mesorhizobium escarrei]|uniref:ABC transmembrane type-1 domain-containing protein n=1 Tax=Mesorhizobium escarrei TaxID=666018 RepID=A0ABM9EJ03_9HYPH|nr:hypothetical protein [Mesorhizobium escarrei]CAH2409370.1 conserved membrane hypothetical protein [Mesorhizobium escarrei]
MATIDPIGDKFYRPLVQFDQASGWIFVLIGALSIAVIAIDPTKAPRLHEVVQAAYISLVVVVLVVGIVAQLYLSPRAEDARRRQILSHAFSTNLTHTSSPGYYNNEQENPLRRLAANVAESSFFTSEISKIMLRSLRAQVMAYVILFVVVASIREFAIGYVAAAATIVFGEQIAMRYLRLEWLRQRSENVHGRIKQMFQTAAEGSTPALEASIIYEFAEYEASKAHASVSLSGRVFKANGERLSNEWEEIKASLKL